MRLVMRVIIQKTWKSGLIFLSRAVFRWLVVLTVVGFGMKPCETVLLAADGVKSVDELNRLKPQWARYAAARQRLTVEGRLSVRATTHIRLQKCSLLFRRKDRKPLPVIQIGTKIVEIEGYLVREKNQYVFHVQAIRQRPSYLQTFANMRLKVNPINFREWYALGDWALQRASFYHDQKLRDKSQMAYQSGVMAERSQLKADDWSGYFQLSEKVKRFKLSSLLMQSLRHEGHRVRWKNYLLPKGKLTAKEKLTFEDVVQGVRKEWPNCVTPLKRVDQKLLEKYRRDPVATYRSSLAWQHSDLHRFFYWEIQQIRIIADAKPDGSNGLDIANRLDALIPELHLLAKSYRKRAWDYRAKHAETLSEKELVLLVKELRRQQQPQQATAVIGDWLKNQLPKQRQKGSVGLVWLSDRYVRLLNDQATAIQLLLEAHRADSESREVSERLTQFGYLLRNGKWLLKSEAEKLPLSPVEKARETGRITIGMSQADVRRVMFGSPTSVSRMTTRRTLSTVWIYGKRYGKRLAIHFQRRHSESPSQAVVVNVTRVSGASASR